MIKKMCLSVIFIFILASHVFAAGFEPGVNVRAIRRTARRLWVLLLITKMLPKYPALISPAHISSCL